MNDMQMQHMQHMQQPSMGAMIVPLAIYGVIVLLMIASMWKVYSKAGKPGWAAIVPIYNIIVLLQIVNKPLWWIILMLIPIVNFIIAIIIYVNLAQCFGKGVGFAIGILLLPFIFLPILGFGSATYQGGAGGAARPAGAMA